MAITRTELAKLAAQGLTDPQISKLTGIPTQTIYSKRRTWSIASNSRRGHRSEVSDERFMEEYNQGKSDPEIAECFGRSRAWARERRYAMDLAPNRKSSQGSWQHSIGLMTVLEVDAHFAIKMAGVLFEDDPRAAAPSKFILPARDHRLQVQSYTGNSAAMCAM